MKKIIGIFVLLVLIATPFIFDKYHTSRKEAIKFCNEDSKGGYIARTTMNQNDYNRMYDANYEKCMRSFGYEIE
jgi:hypothetical protein